MSISEQMEQIFDAGALRPLADAERSALAGIDLFCVLFSNRSGSTLLCDSLYRRGLPIPPQVEILDPSLVAKVSQEAAIPTFTDYFVTAVLGWAKSGAVGFKAGAAQLAWLDELGYLGCFRSLRLLSTARRDKVAQAVSLYLAQQSGQWHAGMPASLAPEEVPYDAQGIAAALETVTGMDAAIRDFAQQSGAPLLELMYEDLLERPDEVLTHCATYLDWAQVPDADFQPAVPPLRRQATAINARFRQRFLAERSGGAVSPPATR